VKPELLGRGLREAADGNEEEKRGTR
jgi:hypothetical protein